MTSKTATVTAADVTAAAQTLRGVAALTPTELSSRLSELAGVPVFLKREDLQSGRSFKLRGAYNRMAHLSEAEKEKGVVCASAGNHAQGVAFACRSLEIHGTIFLPESTPRQKRERIRTIGGPWVELSFEVGPFDQAQKVALEYAARTGRSYIHPYDDRLVIAGQGTVAVEAFRQLEGGIENVLVPVGGGGLIAGMAAWLKEVRPDLRIIGVEAAGAASSRAALDAGAPVDLAGVDSFVDGTAVGRVGDTTYELINRLVDDVVVVDEGAVSTEMLSLYHQDGIIAEPAGALASSAIAAAAAGRIPALKLSGPTVAIISGGNNDLSRYAEVMERSMHYEGLRHYFLVTFPQQPGALRGFLDKILGPEDDIVHFEYTKKNNRDLGPALVGIDLRKPEDIDGLLARMAASSLAIEPIPTDSDLLRFLL